MSGMALVEHNADATTFLVVHDFKTPRDSQDRLTKLELSADWSARPKAIPLELPDGEPQPNDLEAIARVPGTKRFLALESGYYIECGERRFGRLLELVLDASGNCAKVVRIFPLPEEVAEKKLNLEGMICVAGKVDGKTVLRVVVADRTSGTLYAAKLPTANESAKLQGWTAIGDIPLPAPSPQRLNRRCSELWLNQRKGKPTQLFCAATFDPEDETALTGSGVASNSDGDCATSSPTMKGSGFASYVVECGTVDPNATSLSDLVKLRDVGRVHAVFPDSKVEAASRFPGVPQRWILGTDDEAFGRWFVVR